MNILLTILLVAVLAVGIISLLIFLVALFVLEIEWVLDQIVDRIGDAADWCREKLHLPQSY